MNVVYSSFVNIYIYIYIVRIYSCTPSCVSTFKHIVNHNEVSKLQEVQMNISSNL
jgi:hypothetical protein